jgi:hypothetical protein
MQRQTTLTLKTTLLLSGLVLFGCEKLPQASMAPQAEVPSTPTYTSAQQAWLNFVAKVRRGEQQDPTGQYVKDGTTVPADQEQRTRPKFDAARDKYPFRLLPDGTIVLLSKAAKNNTGSKEAPPQPPIEECPFGGCPGVPVPVTSTFVTSAGLGGTGDIVDIKTLYDTQGILGYEKLNTNLNQGAGGTVMFYHFTRFSASVVQGIEYSLPSQFPNLSTADPVVSCEGKTKHWFYQSRPQASPGFAPIWYPDPNQNYNGDWAPMDLNDGAGGEYVYTYQSKQPGIKSDASPFHEIGILSGNSGQIQPPAGWIKVGQDLNDSAGGDFIYFCYKP